jgi:hypothetical protein
MSIDNIVHNRKQEVKEYIQEQLNEVLVKGLTLMAKQKPKEPLEWLAHWLLENNPNKPKITEPLVEEES